MQNGLCPIYLFHELTRNFCSYATCDRALGERRISICHAFLMVLPGVRWSISLRRLQCTWQPFRIHRDPSSNYIQHKEPGTHHEPIVISVKMLNASDSKNHKFQIVILITERISSYTVNLIINCHKNLMVKRVMFSPSPR